jgi:hypothetical protein
LVIASNILAILRVFVLSPAVLAEWSATLISRIRSHSVCASGVDSDSTPSALSIPKSARKILGWLSRQPKIVASLIFRF